MVKKSYAILLYNSGNDERNLKKRIKENFPEKDEIRTIYEHLAYFYQIGVDSGRDATFEFPIDKFCYLFPSLSYTSRCCSTYFDSCWIYSL